MAPREEPSYGKKTENFFENQLGVPIRTHFRKESRGRRAMTFPFNEIEREDREVALSTAG